MLLHLSDLSPEPLHQQVSRQIREKILAGDLRQGDSLPSIRALARDHHISVITVQRAYEDLGREGLLLARQGKGMFVAGFDQKGKQKMAEERLREALAPVLREAKASGLPLDRVLGIVRDLLGIKETE